MKVPDASAAIVVCDFGIKIYFCTRNVSQYVVQLKAKAKSFPDTGKCSGRLHSLASILIERTGVLSIEIWSGVGADVDVPSKVSVCNVHLCIWHCGIML